jgi:hypothetical protein
VAVVDWWSLFRDQIWDLKMVVVSSGLTVYIFNLKFLTVVVGGMELRGMSTMVVNPPAAAADVAVAKPSHAVRPAKSQILIIKVRKQCYQRKFIKDRLNLP